mgnify:CR=1 FL=1
MADEIAGELTIAEDVIADLAGYAALESYGVVGMAAPTLSDGIAKLLPGMKAEDAIARMEGTTCGRKPTSCPDQIAQALKGALAEMG